MRKIGFYGGCRICELGPSSDVNLFFDCLQTYAEQGHQDQGWSLLTDRLYRRYLRREELDKAIALMEQARQLFAEQLAASVVNWDELVLDGSERSWLNLGQPTLAAVFNKYFEGFYNACSSAKSFLDEFDIYRPVRVVMSDMPGFARDKNKPLADYDALEGRPFWLR